MADTASLNVTLPANIKAQLEAAAEMQDRNMGVVVKRAVDHYLNCTEVRETPCPHHYDERGAGVVGTVSVGGPTPPDTK